MNVKEKLLLGIAAGLVVYNYFALQVARVDLFLENWLGILIVGVLGAGLALLAWLVYRHPSKSLQRTM